MSVLTEQRGANLIIRFVKPERRNSLSVDVLEELESLIDSSAVKGDIDRLIFTGTDDVFASGADLREIAALTPELARQFALRGQTLMNKIADVRIHTVAAVNGYCFGGALDLALACKRRIASAEAVFSHPGVGLGIITGWGGTQRLPRLIGRARALEILFTARHIGANEALNVGLVDEIVVDPIARATDV